MVLPGNERRLLPIQKDTGIRSSSGTRKRTRAADNKPVTKTGKPSLKSKNQKLASGLFFGRENDPDLIQLINAWLNPSFIPYRIKMIKSQKMSKNNK